PTLQVTRTGSSRGRITVDYRVTGGTAPAFVPQHVFDSSTNTDYEDFFGTLTFEDGQTTADILVFTFDEIHGQEVFRGPQTVEVTLGNSTGGATLGPITKTVLTIRDDDDANGGFLIRQNGSAIEGSGPVEIEVVRSGVTTTTESVDFATRDGMARAGVNYQTARGTLTFL